MRGRGHSALARQSLPSRGLAWRRPISSCAVLAGKFGLTSSTYRHAPSTVIGVHLRRLKPSDSGL